jgi:hypothetical protein
VQAVAWSIFPQHLLLASHVAVEVAQHSAPQNFPLGHSQTCAPALHTRPLAQVPQSIVPPHPSETAPHFPWQAATFSAGVQHLSLASHTCPAAQHVLRHSTRPATHSHARVAVLHVYPFAQSPHPTVLSAPQLSFALSEPHSAFPAAQNSKSDCGVHPHVPICPPPPHVFGAVHWESSQHSPAKHDPADGPALQHVLGVHSASVEQGFEQRWLMQSAPLGLETQSSPSQQSPTTHIPLQQ